MKRIIVYLLIAVLMLGIAGCKNETAQNPTVSEPEATYPSLPRPTSPNKPTEPTEPGATEPPVVAKPIPQMLPIADGMICDVKQGETYSQLQNPVASHVYNYLMEQKKSAKEPAVPPAPSQELNDTAIQLLFTANGSYALRVWVYADDFVAIHKNANDPNSHAPLYKFPTGIYQSLVLTLEEQNNQK